MISDEAAIPGKLLDKDARACGVKFIEPDLVAAGRLADGAATASVQLFAPGIGLYAIRGGHGALALYALRRAFCGTSASTPPQYRFVHIPLRKPVAADGEAAPLNWVLGPATQNFLLKRALDSTFIDCQTDILRSALGLKPKHADACKPSG